MVWPMVLGQHSRWFGQVFWRLCQLHPYCSLTQCKSVQAGVFVIIISCIVSFELVEDPAQAKGPGVSEVINLIFYQFVGC
jgi:peptidoglycan/LPS O-acetylase OafA/YrhL